MPRPARSDRRAGRAGARARPRSARPAAGSRRSRARTRRRSTAAGLRAAVAPTRSTAARPAPARDRACPGRRRRRSPRAAAAPAWSSGQSSTPRLERRVVDYEPVTDIGGEHALPGVVDLIGGDHFNLGPDAVLGAEVEHLLGLADRADHRAGERTSLRYELQSRYGHGLRRRTDVDQRSVGLQQCEEAADVDRGADRVDDQIEAPCQLLEGGVIARGVITVRAELQSVLLLAQ